MNSDVHPRGRCPWSNDAVKKDGSQLVIDGLL